MHDVERPPDAGQEAGPAPRSRCSKNTRGRERIRRRKLAAPIFPTSEALAAWLSAVGPLVREIRALAEDATAPDAQRVHARPRLRREVLRRLRELEARLRSLAAGAPVPS